jgi:hypothetical protein
MSVLARFYVSISMILSFSYTGRKHGGEEKRGWQ